jgi:chromate transporter
MNRHTQFNIFISFFRSGMLGYGGGPSSIPLVHQEVVKKRQWMSDEEFSDILAIGNTLPGPIVPKMAGYIGYRIGGKIGLINALVASIFPTVILMIILISFLSYFRDSSIVAGMTQAVTAVVGVMLAGLAYSFVRQSISSIGWLLSDILVISSLIIFLVLHVHPAIFIGILLLYGFFSKAPKKRFSQNTENQNKGMGS